MWFKLYQEIKEIFNRNVFTNMKKYVIMVLENGVDYEKCKNSR